MQHLSNTSAGPLTLRNLLLILLLAIYTLCILRIDHLYRLRTSKPANSGRSATTLTARELLSRQLTTNLTDVPKLFHQSWSSTKLPAEFEKWSKSCRDLHPDWEWVLWTDDDNINLVKKYAGWFLEPYEKLKKPIFQADAMRNLYMHVFGGIYADLDVECLEPTETLLEKYGKPKQQQVFLGRMGLNNDKPSSLPNAWYASTPGHPFWLLPLEHIQNNLDKIKNPEDLSGPGALHSLVAEYEESSKDEINRRYEPSEMAGLFRIPDRSSSHTLTILPFWEIYPYSWTDEGRAYIDYCWTRHRQFNDEKCKLLLGTDHWGSHAITYWSHSWGQDGAGHDPKELEKVDGTGVMDGFDTQ